MQLSIIIFTVSKHEHFVDECGRGIVVSLACSTDPGKSNPVNFESVNQPSDVPDVFPPFLVISSNTLMTSPIRTCLDQSVFPWPVPIPAPPVPSDNLILICTLSI